MDDVWETFNNLYNRRIEELKNRLTALERRLAEYSADLSTLNERAGLTLVDEQYEAARASQ